MFWLNGEYRTDSRALSVEDRGFLLGDGLFETVLLIDGVAAFWDAHAGRLARGLALAGIAPVDMAPFPLIARDLAERNACVSGRAVFRLTVTRGEGGRGLVAAAPAAPTVLASVAPAPAAPEAPALLTIAAQARRAREALSSRLKALAYLENIIARREAAAAGADEAIILNDAGRVASASAANLFLWSEPAGRWTTPPETEGALAGVVRGELLAIPGLPTQAAAIDPGQLAGATKFITNSLLGVRAAILPGEKLTTADRERLRPVRDAYEARLAADLERRAALL